MSGLHRRVSVCLMISVHSRRSLDVAMALDPYSQLLGVFGRLSPLYMDWMVCYAGNRMDSTLRMQTVSTHSTTSSQ